MSNSRPVYSTDQGRLCPGCSQPVAACRCGRKTVVAGDGIVRVSRETKGRKGKGVTLVTGVALPDEELRLLGSRLKQLCGTGGTVKDGVIEIQGDHRDRLFEWFQQQGHKVKKAGG
ncbi:MAG: translation initiation factor Sui1 [Pseudohongiellaceae bacterium]